MNFVIGTIKFAVGAAIGASVGAAVTTLLVTRDGGETLTKLQTLVAEVRAGAMEAYKEEENRMSGRYKQLVGDAGNERRTKKALKDADKKSEGK